jgi:hypothetical protein
MSHYHRVKCGVRIGAYEFAATAHLDAIERGGRVVPCRCDAGADEIARRNEGHALRLTSARRES